MAAVDLVIPPELAYERDGQPTEDRRQRDPRSSRSTSCRCASRPAPRPGAPTTTAVHRRRRHRDHRRDSTARRPPSRPTSRPRPRRADEPGGRSPRVESGSPPVCDLTSFAAVDLLEYQGKQFFATFGIPVSEGRAVDTVDEAVAAAEALGYPVVVKAQVHVGGRGKAGGVKLASDVDEVREHAGNILGLDIKGHVVRSLWIEKASRHRRGVLRQLHARPLGQEAPRHALGPGRRRDRGRSPRATPTRSPRSGSTRSTGLTEAACRELGRGRGARPRGHRGRGRHPAQALRGLRRRRRRPLRDQPAHPHHRGPGARARRQGHPRRQLRVPPPRVRASTTRPRSATSARRRRTRRASSTSGLDGSVGIIANGAGLAMSTRRHRQPGRRRAGQLPRHRRRRQRRRDGRCARGHQQRPEGASRSSSTSSAASPRAKRSPTASSTALGRSTSTPRS